MPYKLSRCLCLCTPEHTRAVEFYEKVLGLRITSRTTDSVEFDASPFRIFVDQSDAHGATALGMVFEIIVPSLETARTELLQAGCREVRWLGKGKDCYMRDPFGAVFNVWEEPEAFER